jgi:DNA-binding response OmpR family regulator
MRILIIDDDNDIARALEKFLTIKGHSCKTLNRGSEGLQAIQADTFDIILLDLRMPEWNGFDILRMLAYGGVLHDKKVVVISALDLTVKEREQMKAAGVVDILSKPFSPATLEKVIDSIHPQT